MITDDIFYFAEPMFQDGIIAQAIDLVKARGVSSFSAAGNDSRRSYESPFRPSGFSFDFGGLLGSYTTSIRVPASMSASRSPSP